MSSSFRETAVGDAEDSIFNYLRQLAANYLNLLIVATSLSIGEFYEVSNCASA
jgi:hypothetical protein